jgi:hypothetical protein
MNLSPLPVQKFFDSNGKPLVSGRLFTYVSGTSTKLATYKDQAGTLNTNPIVLDYRGEANVWLDPSLTYKFVLAPAGIDDPPTSTIWTVDNISAALTFASLTQQILGAILYPQSSAELAAGVTPVQYWFPWGIVDRYKANTNPGTTDMTSAFTIALSCNNVVSAPYGPYRSLTGPIAITGNRSCSGAVGGDVGAQPTSIIHDPASTGPLFTLISTEFGSAYLGHFDITGGNGTAAVLTARPQTTIEYLHIEPTGGYNGHGIVSLGGLKLTAALIAGATSATLADKWVAYTAVYSVTFSNGDVRNVTLTNGATTMTWSGGLSAGATDSPIFAQGSWDLTIRSCKVVGPNVAGVMSPNAFRGFIVNVNGGVVALEHNLAALVSVACELVQGQNITLYRNDFNSCGLNASDSFADGQCGIRAMSHNYKLNINVFAQWIEGSPTSINLDNLNGFSIFASFINDLGASNTPAIAIGAAALNVKVDTTFVEVKNTNANVACVSNAADGTILVNNTWNPSNTGGGALAHGIINTANCLEYGQQVHDDADDADHRHERAALQHLPGHRGIPDGADHRRRWHGRRADLLGAGRLLRAHRSARQLRHLHHAHREGCGDGRQSHDLQSTVHDAKQCGIRSHLLGSRRRVQQHRSDEWWSDSGPPSAVRNGGQQRDQHHAIRVRYRRGIGGAHRRRVDCHQLNSFEHRGGHMSALRHPRPLSLRPRAADHEDARAARHRREGEREAPHLRDLEAVANRLRQPAPVKADMRGAVRRQPVELVEGRCNRVRESVLAVTAVAGEERAQVLHENRGADLNRHRHDQEFRLHRRDSIDEGDHVALEDVLEGFKSHDDVRLHRRQQVHRRSLDHAKVSPAAVPFLRLCGKGRVELDAGVVDRLARIDEAVQLRRRAADVDHGEGFAERSQRIERVLVPEGMQPGREEVPVLDRLVVDGRGRWCLAHFAPCDAFLLPGTLANRTTKLPAGRGAEMAPKGLRR